MSGAESGMRTICQNNLHLWTELVHWWDRLLWCCYVTNILVLMFYFKYKNKQNKNISTVFQVLTKFFIFEAFNIVNSSIASVTYKCNINVINAKVLWVNIEIFTNQLLALFCCLIPDSLPEHESHLGALIIIISQLLLRVRLTLVIWFIHDWVPQVCWLNIISINNYLASDQLSILLSRGNERY